MTAAEIYSSTIATYLADSIIKRHSPFLKQQGAHLASECMIVSDVCGGSNHHQQQHWQRIANIPQQTGNGLHMDDALMLSQAYRRRAIAAFN